MTARNVTRTFTVISGHDPLSEDELSGLVSLGGTAVILMGVGTLGNTLTGLHRMGMSPTTPVAVVERGFSDEQRVLIDGSANMIATAAAAKIRPPAVLVVGEVVSLAAASDDEGRAVLNPDNALSELRAMANQS
ncbi:hypothetical protein [Nesterenkonia pannonica]|uniref:hypothetical protein n=1 Tax=Nesterenkonia pannonica TaxID=1548602 RepID=UPI002164134D|nr:hypothetical protein [Nesterenkonia pannonica]